VETSSLMYPEAPAEEDLVYIPPGEVVGTPVTTSLTWAGGDDTEGLSTGGRSRESIGASSTRKEQEIREKLATLPGAEIAGFMPLRGDFDIEYHNDAEELLVDMEFHKDDTPAEVAMKLQVMGIYNNKLRERNDRKAFVIERGIIDTKKQCQ
ncbi:ADA2A, partial [Symbiodinium microadriaticum]